MRITRRRFLHYSALVTSSLAMTGIPLYAFADKGGAAKRDEVRRSYCGLCHPRCGTLLHMRGGEQLPRICRAVGMFLRREELPRRKTPGHEHAALVGQSHGLREGVLAAVILEALPPAKFLEIDCQVWQE